MRNIPRVVANCKIIGLIGQGGMGAVYRAVHTTLHRKIALKILPHEFTRSPEYVTRFLREARAVANLNHPNIVTVYDAGEQDGLYYIAMEMIEGASLSAMLRRKKTLPEADALDLMAQAAKGLAAAHANGLIHRDIKPENLLVNPDGTLKIVDFGLVLEASAQSHLTRTGTFLGTPTFMSPEQCDGDVADGRSDLYSLGASFFAVLTGQPPFKAPTALGILYKHKFEAPPDPRRLVPGISEATCTVLLKLMEKKREDRYADGRTLLKDIEQARRTAAPPPESWSFEDAVTEAVPPIQELPPGALTPGTAAAGALSPAPRPGASAGGPRTAAPLEPTLIRPGATPSPPPPASSESTGLEPTLLSPPPPTPGAAATPAPGPLPGVPTPTAPPARADAARPSWLWLGVAAAVLGAVGLGGYFGYRHVQRGGFLEASKRFLEAGQYRKAFSEVERGLRSFSQDPDLLGRQEAIRQAWLQQINELANRGDLANAGKAAATALTLFRNDEEILAAEANIKKDQVQGLVREIRDLFETEEFERAYRKTQKARRTFFDNKELAHWEEKTEQAYLEARASGLVKLKRLLGDAEQQYRQEKYEEAIKLLVRAETTEQNFPTNRASTRLREIRFEWSMRQSEAAERSGRLDEALQFARQALRLSSKAAPRVQELDSHVKIEGVRKLAQRQRDRGEYELAAATLEGAAVYANDEQTKADILKEANDYRVQGYLAQAKQYEDGKNWLQAVMVLNRAQSLFPKDEKIRARLDAANKQLTGNKKHEELIREGVGNLAGGNYDRAIVFLGLALKQQKDDPSTQKRLHEALARKSAAGGDQAQGARHWEKARQIFEKAVKEADASEAAPLKKEIAGKLKNVQDEIARIKKLELEAGQLKTRNQVDEALAAYRKLKNENPDRQPFYARQLAELETLRLYYKNLADGDAFLAQGQWKEARNAYDRALMQKDDPETNILLSFRKELVGVAEHGRRGEAFLQKNRVRDAVDELDRAERIYQEALRKLKEAKGKVPRNALELKVRLDGKRKQARAIFEKENAAQSAKKSKAWAEAEQLFRELKKLNPPGQAAYEKERALAAQKAEEARQYEARLKKFKGRMAAAGQLKKQGRLDEALAQAREAQKLFARDASAQRLVNELQGAVQARKIRRITARILPKVNQAVKAGNLQQAKGLADAAVQEAGGGAVSLRTMAGALGKMSESQTALASARQKLARASKALKKTVARSYAVHLDKAAAALERDLERARKDFLSQAYAQALSRAEKVAREAHLAASKAVSEVARRCVSKAHELETTTSNPIHGAEVGEISVDDGGGSEVQDRERKRKARKYREAARKIKAALGVKG